MKVLVTGSNGFIGKNLIAHLNEMTDIKVISFDKEDNFSKIEDSINEIDFIIHLAGINRPVDVKEFYEGNTDLTKKIVDLIKNKNIPILISSSIQAVKDNDYGKSKKLAEDYIKENLTNYYLFRLHNVFGKWCLPNYNSVTATFCYNIANNLEIKVSDPNNSLELIYIDDIISEFINVIKTKKATYYEDGFCYINPRYNITLGYMVEKLNEFKESMSSISVPNTGDEFIKKLYSTYISYVKVNELVTSAKMLTDERGFFSELVKFSGIGQISISSTKPHIVRGNHYHHTKLERFIVIRGKAKMRFKHIITNDYFEVDADETDLKIVTIPVGYTHNIENTGETDMMFIMWCNEVFDSNKPDTYFRKID